ncbi:MAG TPA: PorP/SprF family type IX secretion system membrane protein [Bacteroidia bacterium]|nr:PorP/SprF family type IX secretion system membrane protein [Bacteroidia bacterium]
MKTNFIKPIVILASALIVNTIAAQDIHFSQFYMSPLTVNPALAGAQHDMTVAINYKDQWQSVASPYKTVAASWDMRMMQSKNKKGFAAVGVNFFSDRSGDAKLGTTQGNATVAYHVRLNSNNTFGGGVQAGFAQRSISFGSLTWGNQFDGLAYNATLPSGEPAAGATVSYADFGGGLDWNFDNRSGAKNVTDNHDQKINFGIALYHIGEPKYAFYSASQEKLFMRYSVHGSALLSVPNSNIAFAPAFMYEMQGPSKELYAGSLLRFSLSQDSKYTGFKQGAAISFGGFLRAKDAVAAVMLLEYSHYALGISYDVNVSGLKTASNSRGGIEIALRFVSPNPFQPSSSSSFFN